MKINNSQILKQKPKAIIFDLDNTLYNYEITHQQAYETVKQKAVKKLNISAEQFDSSFNEAKKQVKSRLKNTASSHSRLLYFQTMLEIIGLRSQVLLALDFEQTYWNKFLTAAEIFPGVRELLDDLRITGIPTVILTDLTTQIQFRKISFWGLDKFFENIVTSEETGIEKPAAEAFSLAMYKLGNPGSPVWMIGDNYESDIKGAKDAIGAFGLLRTDSDKNADVTFTNFQSIRKLLEDNFS